MDRWERLEMTILWVYVVFDALPKVADFVLRNVNGVTLD